VTVAAQPPFVLLRTVPASRARPWTSLAETGRPALLAVATTSSADPAATSTAPGGDPLQVTPEFDRHERGC
jgi:hypothetical protein